MIDKLKIGLLVNGPWGDMPGPYGEEPCGEMFADLKQIGYDAVELLWQPGRVAEKKSAAEAAGLILSEIVFQRDYVTRDPAEGKENVRLTAECIKECAAAGVDTINVFTGPAPWIPDPVIVGKDISQKEAWDRVFEAFDAVVPVAEENGVRLALEGVWCHLCHDFFTAKYLVDRYRSDYLGVNFDPSHDVISNNTDMDFLVKGWGGAIKHIHLKDAVGVMEPGRFIFPLLGEGFVDWKAFRKALDDIGYEGVCSVEFESAGYLANYCGGDLRQAARLSFEILKKLLKKE
ncbi:MAG: sugar phosphate isomerase/epimerase [Abditibacteriota bacterium]|nr:sugar phosphate isomerase/epimerase [Abditibacteriota bacterium]